MDGMNQISDNCTKTTNINLDSIASTLQEIINKPQNNLNDSIDDEPENDHSDSCSCIETEVENEISEELWEEDVYIEFGPGGDPGPDKRNKENSMVDDGQDELVHYFHDECDSVNSYDSYFEEDYFDFENDY